MGNFLKNKSQEVKNEQSKHFNQFYTNSLVALEIVKKIRDFFDDYLDFNFIEPSAGTGSFLDALISLGVKKKQINAFEIDSFNIQQSHYTIKQSNYLEEFIPFKKKNLTVGNPPFGKRGRLASQFLNKSLSESSTVFFILPNIFQRFSAQKKINQAAALIYSQPLKSNSFILNNRKYDVRCVLQVWTTDQKLAHKYQNLRLRSAPQIRHADFQTFIYNNTKGSLKYFNKELYKWDFAVHRQGYYDYSLKIFEPQKLLKKRQYFFIKAKNSSALEIIQGIDFEKLSKSNTQTYGFSTSDFVSEYKRLKALKNHLPDLNNN